WPGSDNLRQEPGSTAAPRGVARVQDQAFESPAGAAAFVGRAFFGGWGFDRGRGIAEELSGQGRRRQGRRWRGFSRPETLERDACGHDRSEITRSPGPSAMPRTPMESRPLQTRTSVTG